MNNDLTGGNSMLSLVLATALVGAGGFTVEPGVTSENPGGGAYESLAMDVRPGSGSNPVRDAVAGDCCRCLDCDCDSRSVRPAAETPKAAPAARRPKAVTVATPTWRVPSDNPSIEVLSSDGRTYSAWRYRAGYTAPATYGYGSACAGGSCGVGYSQGYGYGYGGGYGYSYGSSCAGGSCAR